MPPIDGELTAPDDSLRGELEAVFGGGNDSDASEHVAERTASDPSLEVSEQADGPRNERGGEESPAGTAQDDRARGPDGKFLPKDAKAAPEKVAAAQELPSTDATKANPEAAQTATAVPPVGWTAAEKAEWSKLPPVVQAAVSRREAEMTRGGQQWSEEKRRYESVLSPVAEAARRNGLTTEDGLNAMLRAQAMLERDAPAAIRWLAQSHNVNLATLAGQNPDEVPSATQQPDIEAMVRRIVSPIVAPIQQRWNEDATRQQDMTMQTIHSFASAQGHEHYAAVEGTIALLLPQIIEEHPAWSHEQKLQEAYDRALYATPATRQAVLAAKEQAAAETRRTEAATRATKARGAAVSVTGSPHGSAAPESAGTLREEIVRAMTG